jgi:hypothetical protein
MYTKYCLSSLLPILFICCAACVQDVEADQGEALGETSEALITSNGTGLNGTSLNGTSLNGTSLNGTSLNGTSLNGTSLNGTDFIGATMTGTQADGQPITLRIDDIQATADPDINVYTISYAQGSTWVSICGYDGEVPVKAIPLQGRWDYSSGTASGGDHIDDPTQITFACRGSTLAKCTELGYKPWESIQECEKDSCKTVSLRHYHQACTRLLRADYCGDGTPHTLTGTPINVWDEVGIQARSDVGSAWKIEAEWGDEGALCIKDWRYDPGSITSEYVEHLCDTNMTASFSCFGDDSTFFEKNSNFKKIDKRSLLRNEFDYYHVYNATHP